MKSIVGDVVNGEAKLSHSSPEPTSLPIIDLFKEPTDENAFRKRNRANVLQGWCLEAR
jgi:hypothetical protein